MQYFIERLPPWTHLRPEISHFEANAIIFSDGSSSTDIDAIVLATGYEKRFPFLEETGWMHVRPTADSNDTYDLGLVTNTRYFFPLFKQFLPIIPQIPVNALAFMCIIENVLRLRVSFAQTLLLAHAIINPNILPSRQEMYNEVSLREEHYRKSGYDVYRIGHFIFDEPGAAKFTGMTTYMDSFVDDLKDHKIIPNDGKNFTPPWINERAQEIFDTIINWKKIMEEGNEQEWLSGVRTEDEWADLMHRVAVWGNESSNGTDEGM